MELLYILGIDGAGKTTVAREIARLAGGVRLHPSRYWSAMPAVRRLGWKVTRTRPKTPGRGDAAYYKACLAMARKRRRAAWLVGWLWLLDGSQQCRRMSSVARRLGRPVIVDRYYLDSAVAASVLMNVAPEGVLRLASHMERIVPRATRHLWLDVSVDIALTRKADIHSIDYLRDRRDRYRVLSGAYSAARIDADQPLEAVLRDAAAWSSCAAWPDRAGATVTPAPLPAAPPR